MSYTIINHCERSALSGLPYLQQLTYIHGLKPYVDYQTEMIGIKRRVSYQSLAEDLYIEPHPGFVQSGSPSKNQIRRALNGLEKAGLIEIQSLEKQLIFKCLLLDRDNSVQNKPDTNPTHQPNTNPNEINDEKSGDYEKTCQKDNTPKTAQPDIPLNNNYLLFFLLNAFEEFWELYPVQNNRDQALEVFKKLNPSEKLFEEIKTGLKKQIAFYQMQLTVGHWMPAWKYPANWLAQQCWKNLPEINHPPKENRYEPHQHDTEHQDRTNSETIGYSDAEFNRLWKTQ